MVRSERMGTTARGDGLRIRAIRRSRRAAGAAVLGLLAQSACHSDTPAAPTPLSATCSAAPASGVAPLTVSFALNVSGAQGSLSVQIAYGDGGTGTDPAARHTYSSPGSFTASFAVRTPSQSALCSAAVRVDAPPAPTPTPGPPPQANQPPSAVFRTVPEAGQGNFFGGTAPLEIQFNMCPTSDPENDPLRFTMDFEGDGVLDLQGSSGAECRHAFTFGVGSFSPRICVTDLLSSLTPAHPFQCKTYSVRLTPKR